MLPKKYIILQDITPHPTTRLPQFVDPVGINQTFCGGGMTESQERGRCLREGLLSISNFYPIFQTKIPGGAYYLQNTMCVQKDQPKKFYKKNQKILGYTTHSVLSLQYRNRKDAKHIAQNDT